MQVRGKPSFLQFLQTDVTTYSERVPKWDFKTSQSNPPLFLYINRKCFFSKARLFCIRIFKSKVSVLKNFRQTVFRKKKWEVFCLQTFSTKDCFFPSWFHLCIFMLELPRLFGEYVSYQCCASGSLMSIFRCTTPDSKVYRLDRTQPQVPSGCYKKRERKVFPIR